MQRSLPQRRQSDAANETPVLAEAGRRGANIAVFAPIFALNASALVGQILTRLRRAVAHTAARPLGVRAPRMRTL